jgi:hypothetical protein
LGVSFNEKSKPNMAATRRIRAVTIAGNSQSHKTINLEIEPREKAVEPKTLSFKIRRWLHGTSTFIVSLPAYF